MFNFCISNRFKSKWLFILLIFGVVSCGGGSDSEGNNDSGGNSSSSSSSSSSASSSSSSSSSSGEVLPPIAGACVDEFQLVEPIDADPNTTQNVDGSIIQLPSGDVRFENTVFHDAHTSYIFVKVNGVLIRKNGQITDNGDGSYVHSYVRPAAEFSHGDEIEARFVTVESYSASEYVEADTGNFTYFTPELPERVEGEPFIIPWGDKYIYQKSGEIGTTYSGDLSQNYVGQLASGDVIFCHQVDFESPVSQLFYRVNGVQGDTTPIVIDHGDGQYSHAAILASENFQDGDEVDVRFYVVNSGAGIFVPGPLHEGWSEKLIYRSGYGESYLSHSGSSASPHLPELGVFDGSVVLGAGPHQGYSVYRYDLDDEGVSNCEGDCLTSWSPVTVLDGVPNGTPALSQANIASIQRADGTEQVTLDGMPLYRFIADDAINAKRGEGGPWHSVVVDVPDSNDVVMRFAADTILERPVVFDRGDAIITRFSDRVRDRHAREDDPDFQKYDHYLTHYWEHRTARYEIADYVTKGESKLEIKYITEWTLNAKEFRAFYSGEGGTNSYHDGAGAYTVIGDVGRYDADFNFIDGNGTQRLYTVTLDNYYPLRLDSDIPRPENLPLEVGQYMEFESSLFIDRPPIGRDNYYATTFLYRIGLGGLVPWRTEGVFNHASPLTFKPEDGERENSHPIDVSAWLGGWTTLPYMYSGEPDNHFMQMATNLSDLNGQAFVLGRRVHHTHFDTGMHDENPDNGSFDALKGLVGTHYVNKSCSSCHERNGRALVAPDDEALTRWVFKVAGPDGKADPKIGSVLQPNNIGIPASQGEGRVAIDYWSEDNNGLRSPNYVFEKGTPAYFSARIAPQLVGLGLLDAVDERVILEWEDIHDSDGDGISGKAQISRDPETGEQRLGRFGWKAGAGSLRHQIAGALNADMGVMTSVLPTPDCGSEQTSCGNNTGPELPDEQLDELVKYNALLGVRARRDIDDPLAMRGQTIFKDIGCEKCHRETLQTSEFYPLAELRNQTIHPYTDMLLHDMGEGLADNLGEGRASGAEWRTTPLWGLGLAKDVSEGTGDEYKTGFGYLHDGRARTLEEAILWHGGEAESSKTNYESLTLEDRQALIKFLESL